MLGNAEIFSSSCLTNADALQQLPDLLFFLQYFSWIRKHIFCVLMTHKHTSKTALDLVCSRYLSLLISSTFWQTKFFLLKKKKKGGQYFCANGLVNVKMLVWWLECCNFKSGRCCFFSVEPRATLLSASLSSISFTMIWQGGGSKAAWYSSTGRTGCNSLLESSHFQNWLFSLRSVSAEWDFRES